MRFKIGPMFDGHNSRPRKKVCQQTSNNRLHNNINVSNEITYLDSLVLVTPKLFLLVATLVFFLSLPKLL